MAQTRRGRAKQGLARARLLEAALKQFTAVGFEGASIRDIGREAGLTNPALYRHFAGKEELGAALYLSCYRCIVAEMEEAAQAHAVSLDKVVAAVMAIHDLIERELAVFLYVDENQTRFWPAIRREFGPRTISRRFSGWIAAGRRDGSIDTTISQPAQVALAMGGLSEWAALSGAGLVSAGQGRDLGAAVRRALRAN